LVSNQWLSLSPRSALLPHRPWRPRLKISSSFSFSIFDRRSLAEVCAEQRRIHELRQRMRLLTANDIEDEDDDEDEDDRRGEGSIDQSLQMRNSSVSKRSDQADQHRYDPDDISLSHAKDGFIGIPPARHLPNRARSRRRPRSRSLIVAR
jgi:hypothetical protein